MSLANIKIISGGQTGADRAALDFALARGIPHGGWCPQGQLAEDGPIAPRYQLRETPSPDYDERTEWNVRDADGTVLFSVASEVTGGSRATVELAQKHGKPLLHLFPGSGPPSPEHALIAFLREHRIQVLNVAGPRASVEPGVADFVSDILCKTWHLAEVEGLVQPTKIETERLVLRPLVPDDAPVMARLAGRREIADTMVSIPHPFSELQAREWIIARTTRSKGREMFFAITHKGDGCLVGTIGLREIDPEHSQAEMGFWIGVEWWGRGYGTEATRSVVRFAFERLGLNRVAAHHMVRNPASGRVLENIGMKPEGLLRQRVRKWEVFEDVVLCAILRAEWAGTAPHDRS